MGRAVCCGQRPPHSLWHNFTRFLVLKTIGKWTIFSAARRKKMEKKTCPTRGVCVNMLKINTLLNFNLVRGKRAYNLESIYVKNLSDEELQATCYTHLQLLCNIPNCYRSWPSLKQWELFGCTVNRCTSCSSVVFQIINHRNLQNSHFKNKQMSTFRINTIWSL